MNVNPSSSNQNGYSTTNANGSSSTHETTTTTTTTTTTSLTSSSYQHVMCKKSTGTIILNESRLAFYPAKTEAAAAAPPPLQYTWESIAKHQVSPSNHPRHLLKILFHALQIDDHGHGHGHGNGKNTNGNTNANGGGKAKVQKPQTYEFKSRSELERIRNDISSRLNLSRRVQAQNAQDPHASDHANANGSRKRKIDSLHASPLPVQSGMSMSTDTHEKPTESESTTSTSTSTSTSTFRRLTPSEHSVARSSLLASDRNILNQFSTLAGGNTKSSTRSSTAPIGASSPTVSQQDFWTTHRRMCANQAAKTHGFVSKGISSAMKSSLDIQINGNVSKPIKLGVEEMRQIFIMYPAVHDTYEEKVPLELSEEQFWRKYLESEYFHRDRGRVGSSARSVTGLTSRTNEKESSKADDEEEQQKKKQKQRSQQEEDKEREETARMGAASSNDIFSRKEMELRKREAKERQLRPPPSLKDLAVGQFDLTATANTERGTKLLLNSNDLHPFDDRGKKVIEKYNKHWAMVLNPEDASAGCDLTDLARRSTQHSLRGDDDAKVNGGFGKEFRRLVGFANADEHHVDHVKGMGDGTGDGDDDDEEEPSLFQELNLKNVDAYAGKKLGADETQPQQSQQSMEKMKQDAMFSQIALKSVTDLVAPLVNAKTHDGDKGSSSMSQQLENAFPDPNFGKALLEALTKHMVLDSMTEKDTAKMAKSLPEEFRKKLTSYTRRSNELLRHFFALRHVMETEKKLKQKMKGGGATGKVQSSQKLKKIVAAMEGVYREMEGMRKDLPQSEQGEQMRKMCLPIMDNLDWAFKLNRDSSDRGGGFVTVED